jgi:hypothetical protein
MKPSVCLYCGELIAESGNALSRSSNLCASCSSLSDGMMESNGFEPTDFVQPGELAAERLEALPTAA